MTHSYKGYEIERVTKKDYIVRNPDGNGFLVHEKTMKAAKAAIDNLEEQEQMSSTIGKTYYVKGLTAVKPGKLEWKTIRTFTDRRIADEWLMAIVTKNHYDIRDFTISTTPDILEK